MAVGWFSWVVVVIPPQKKKKGIKKEGYLSKIVYGVNFIINVSKRFLENKVETLAIYIHLSCQCIWRDILREETTQITSVEKV